MDRDQLGQLIRFTAHGLDKAKKCENKGENRGQEKHRRLQSLIKEWRERGYEFGPDKVWAQKINGSG